MDFELSEEHKVLQRAVREFAEKEIMPIAPIDERSRRFQRETVTRMGELGFFGCPIPEEYGGNNMGFVAHAIVCEEIARASCSLGVLFNTQTMGTSRALLEFGTEEQKRNYIPKLVSAEWLGCFAVTEPDAGNDVAAMSTTAVKDGDYYILNGTKTWISLAQVADTGIIFAYTEPDLRHHGISAFIVDMNASGVSFSPDQEKLGWRAAPTAEIYFDNVKVPANNLLAEPEQGFKIMMRCFDNLRLTAAARAVGNCQALLDESVKHATQRVQFGQEIGQFQMVQEVIARMVVETDAARLLTYRCAGQKEKGILNNTLETSMAKYFASEAASKIADGAFRIMGTSGCAGSHPVGRLLRDAKMHQIIDGSSNIHKMIISTDALGYRKANR
ncbi:MAG: acyl-CoA dehydrogenase family protein [Dehalococcoidia bacterium]|nr:acyl-CoA dehydrogenase family protein [Dehalococcoidia bacterium]